MVKKYLHGTTVENLIGILRRGKIICDRKKKVWADYSEDAVYLMLETTKHCDRDDMFVYTGEQASFVVYQYNHTRRVVLEVELDESKLLNDSDSMYGVKIYEDIDISKITNVYIEKEDNSCELKKLTAITLLLRDEFKKSAL